jgi:lysophospholipase L1-like esterase
MSRSLKQRATLQTVADATAFNAANDARYAKLVGASTNSLGRTKAFDPARSCYNVNSSSFRRWNAALTNALTGGAAANLNIYGDSISAGYLATPYPYVSSWPTRLRDMFAKQYGNTGQGIMLLTDYTGGGGDPRITQTGTWTRQNAALLGPFAYACMLGSPGSTMTFTLDSTMPTDALRLHIITSSGGAADHTISVDGGAATTFTSISASEGNSVITKAAGASGAHTYVVTVGSTGLYLIGPEPVNGTSGVRVNNYSKGGAKAIDLAGATTSGGRSLPTSFDMTVPKLSAIVMGMNEYLGQQAIATYKTNMQTLIDKSVAKGADTLLIVTVPDGTTPKTIPQSDYAAAYYDLADTNNLPLIDLQHRWTSYAVSNAFAYYGDPTHPSTFGYMDIARTVYNVVNFA